MTRISVFWRSFDLRGKPSSPIKERPWADLRSSGVRRSSNSDRHGPLNIKSYSFQCVLTFLCFNVYGFLTFLSGTATDICRSLLRLLLPDIAKLTCVGSRGIETTLAWDPGNIHHSQYIDGEASQLTHGVGYSLSVVYHAQRILRLSFGANVVLISP